ncbi:MAG: rod shape-determining protein MreC [Clostridiales bacterium]|nr:rod shape-determining protein MreC [Clostridiales bacterium]
MKWIKAHKFLTGIIGTALVLCLIIVLSFLSDGSTSPVGRQIQGAVAFIQRPIASATFGIRDGIFNFRHIIVENDQLREENARLRREINSTNLTAQDLQDLRELANIFNYDIMDYNHRAIAANVIALDGTNWFNVFTIDRGTRDGIYQNAVVVNHQGLVGTVMEAGTNWARVISVIDSTNRVSFIVARDHDIVGILQGDGQGGLTGFALDNQAGIIVGDVLLTSGIDLGSMYPKGIDIGRVTAVDFNIDTQLKTIEIEPSVRFNNLRKVAVIL